MESSQEENELPLKRVELSLSKFNEVAIPHHLDLLRQHKANIIKYCEGGEYGRVRAEQAAAARAAARLRALLADLEALRRRVRRADRAAFDDAARAAAHATRRAVADYTDVIRDGCKMLVERATDETRPCESSPMVLRRLEAGAGEEECVAGSATSTSSVGLVSDVVCDVELAVQLRVEEEAAEREAALRGYRQLQAEVAALHDAWCAMSDAALQQGAAVSALGGAVDVAAADVGEARARLAAAERMSGAGVALGGAALGALVGGPVGAVVGLKAGAAAALAGSLLGYSVARWLPRTRTRTPGDHAPDNTDKAD